MDYFESSIKSKEEFTERLYKLFKLLEMKENKSSSEKTLYNTLNEVNEYIIGKTSLKYNKGSYNNMLPYFELGGGWEMMKSDVGKEATDLLYYFVQNY